MEALFTVLKILKAFNRVPRTIVEIFIWSFIHNMMTEELEPIMKKWRETHYDDDETNNEDTESSKEKDTC